MNNWINHFQYQRNSFLYQNEEKYNSSLNALALIIFVSSIVIGPEYK